MVKQWEPVRSWRGDILVLLHKKKCYSWGKRTEESNRSQQTPERYINTSYISVPYMKTRGCK